MNRHILLSLMLLVFTVTLSAADLPSEVQDDVQSHLNTIKRIDSLSCDLAFHTIDAEMKDGSKIIWTAKYFRHQDSVRAISNEKGKTRDDLNQSGVMSSINWDPDPKNRKLSKSKRKSVLSPRYDAYSEMLFALNIPATIEYAPLDEIIQKAVKCEYPKSDPDSPHLLLTFNNDDARSTLDIQFSRRHNNLIDKVIYTIKTERGSTRRVQQVETFQEVLPGIHVPTLITLHGDFNGMPYDSCKTVVSNIVCNKHDPRNFVQRFPNNTPVLDTTTRSSYNVNSSGGKITAEKPIKSIPKIKAPDDSHTGDTVSESARPGKSGFGYYTEAIILGLIGAGIVLYRILRNRQTA